jgi:hypothetical protein
MTSTNDKIRLMLEHQQIHGAGERLDAKAIDHLAQRLIKGAPTPQARAAL